MHDVTKSPGFLAPGLGLDWVEKDLQPYDVVNADEAWLTTTPYCMAPCVKINSVPIGDGGRGPVFGEMMAAWSDLLRRGPRVGAAGRSVRRRLARMAVVGHVSGCLRARHAL